MSQRARSRPRNNQSVVALIANQLLGGVFLLVRG
jgi:hypothetical protein